MDLLNMTGRTQSMNFIYKKEQRKFYLSNQSYQLWWFISGMKVGQNCKILAQYLQNYASQAKKYRDLGYEYH